MEPLDHPDSRTANSNPEDVLEAFEADWKRDDSPCLDRFADQLNGVEWLRQLVWLDLDYRCRRISEDSASAQSPPVVEQYWRQLPQLGGLETLDFEAVAEEYAARLRWRLPCPLTDYQRRFPRFGASLPVRLRQVDEQLSLHEPLGWLRVFRDDQLAFCTGLRTPVELGRQAADEPAPFRRVVQPTITRIVIAALPDTRLSRRQLKVEFVDINGVDRVRLENLSRKSDLLLDRYDLLASGKQAIAELPLVVASPPLRILIDAAGI